MTGDYSTVNDVGRDLMEIEALLRDFLREPSQVQKWAESVDDHATAGAFSFGRIMDRLRASTGLDQDYVLPDKHEYMAHSESLHPTPRGDGHGAWGVQDRRVQFDHDLGDLLTHLGRTLAATIQLADATGLFEARMTQLMGDLVQGDVLTVWKLDRLSRSPSHLIAVVDELGRRGVEFRSLTETLDTTSPSGRLLFVVMSAVAKFEREMARERTAAALTVARAQDRPLGRPSRVNQYQYRMS